MAGFLARRREERRRRKEAATEQAAAESRFLAYAEEVLADDIVAQDEDERLGELLRAATGGVEITSQSKFWEVGRRIAIAQANAGRLPRIDAPQLMAKPGEDVIEETHAALKKEVALSHREFRGSGAGVSFRLAKGIRVRYGGVKGVGYTVYDGTAVVTEDVGVLAVTTKRLVFIGQRKTFEVLYSKLASLSVYENGLAVSATNRQRTLTLEGFDGPVLAAYINAAVAALD